MMNDSNDRAKQGLRETLLAVTFLCVLTGIVFANTFKNDFVGYDDQNLIVGNESIRSLSPSAVARMFEPEHRGNYQPLRELSYAVDYAVWGSRPFGFQLTNILLHMLTVIGVWLLARKLVTERTALGRGGFNGGRSNRCGSSPGRSCCISGRGCARRPVGRDGLRRSSRDNRRCLACSLPSIERNLPSLSSYSPPG